jgi:4-amino-4-deoxy-L-arabinose transferase-like glycosyltransferase
VTVSRQTAWLLAAAALLLLAFAFDLGGYALLEPDEGRNAEVAREMAESNDYVLPTLNGLPYLDKPALYFAVGASLMEVLGPTELAARLPSLLFTLGTLALVFWFGMCLSGRLGAWTATLVTAATPFTLAYARTVIFDSALTMWTTLSLLGFWMAVEGPRGPGNGQRGDDRETRSAQRVAGGGTREGGSAWWTALAWAAMGCGVLTKGPIALALPLMIVVPYAIWRRRARALFDWVAVLLFVAVVLPWVFAVSQDIPDFLEYALVTETARRLTTAELGRTGPLWYFLVILPAAALPWSVIAIAALRDRRRARAAPSDWQPGSSRDPRIVFLLSWILVPLLFFTISQSKRPQYVLPLMPAVGLLVALLWQGARGRLAGVRPGAVALALIGVFLAAVSRLIPGWVPASPAVAAAIPGTALALGVVCLAAGAAAWVAASRREIVLLCLSLPVVAIPFVSRGLMNAIGVDRSAAEVARAIEDVTGSSARVIGVQVFPLSLPFYLRHTVFLSTADGSELTSNYLMRTYRRWRRAPGSPLRHAQWWQEELIACTHPTVFVTRADDDAARTVLAAQLAPLVETRKYAAYGPCGEEQLAEGSPTQPAE